MRSKLLFFILLLASLLAVVSPVTAANRQDYIVQPGDSLTRIAALHSLSVVQLSQTNGLSIYAWVYVGQRLVIPGVVSAPTQQVYIVQPGDMLSSIALRYGIRLRDLALANNLYWNSGVYIGQRLFIPQSAYAPADPVVQPPLTPEPPALNGDIYVVQAGNTLFSIARWHHITVDALRATNGLFSNTIYVGQILKIPGGSDSAPGVVPTPLPVSSPEYGGVGEKWIDINLTSQTTTAYVKQAPVYTALASTGLWGTPTVVGTYEIYVKYPATRMSGPGYDLPNVPHVMYFFRGYGLHGAYWHNNFGTPMSHGCVNLSLPDAEWLYNWAPLGTPVVIHY